MTLTQPQRSNINRTIEAYCAKTGHERADLTSADAQRIAETMGVHVYPNVIESIEAEIGARA